MDLDDLPSDSDSSDEDYVPTGVDDLSDGDLSNGDDVEDENEGQNLGKTKKVAKGRKRKATGTDTFTRKRAGGICLEEDDEKEKEETKKDDYAKELEQKIQEEKEVKKEIHEKKKSDDLWADFMKDVGPAKPKPRASGSGLGSLAQTCKPAAQTKTSSPCQPKTSTATSEASQANGRKPSKVTITKEYDFAGETIKVTKEVAADSKEALAEKKKQEKETEPQTSKPTAGPNVAAWKRPASGGGLGSVLGKIGKKPKMGTLQKSKLDWDSFKEREQISEELEIHNRGKEGYMERQQFLQRADVRQFEIERSLRMGSSSKR